MNSSGLVSIIIVNWNGAKWLKDCFMSLKNQNYTNIEVIFVDNASEDGSVEWVKKHYPEIKIIINKKNLGFAEANNIGYKASRGRYVLFLNNDTKVTKTFLTELVHIFQHDKAIGGVQSKILLMDRPDIHDSVGAFLTPTGFLYHYGFGKKNLKKYDHELNLYTAKGACMMFRKDVLDKVSIKNNIFDPDYFAYFEETDLCHRIWLAGFRIVYAYKSVIYHKMGATSGTMNNSFIQYHSFKNRIRTYLKNFGSLQLLEILPVHIILCQLYAAISFFKGNAMLGLAIEMALWWNLMHIFDSMRIRTIIQKKIRTVSDFDLKGFIFAKPKLSYYMKFLLGNITTYEE